MVIWKAERQIGASHCNPTWNSKLQALDLGAYLSKLGACRMKGVLGEYFQASFTNRALTRNTSATYHLSRAETTTERGRALANQHEETYT
jgi:hypothetical protein